MSHLRLISRFGLPALSASLLAALAGVALSPARPTQAAVVDGGKGPQLLIGRDDDNILNADIQAGATADQSLGRTDIIEGGPGNDVIFGLNGNDVIDGGPGATSSSADRTAERHPAVPQQRHHVWRTGQRCEPLGARRWK